MFDTVSKKSSLKLQSKFSPNFLNKTFSSASAQSFGSNRFDDVLTRIGVTSRAQSPPIFPGTFHLPEEHASSSPFPQITFSSATATAEWSDVYEAKEQSSCLVQPGTQPAHSGLGLRMMSDESDDFCYEDEMADETNNTQTTLNTSDVQFPSRLMHALCLDNICPNATEVQIPRIMSDDSIDNYSDHDGNSDCDIRCGRVDAFDRDINVPTSEEPSSAFAQIPTHDQRKNHTPPRRRRQSVINVAERWGMSLEDAAEIMMNVEMANPNTAW